MQFRLSILYILVFSSTVAAADERLLGEAAEKNSTFKLSVHATPSTNPQKPAGVIVRAEGGPPIALATAGLGAEDTIRKEEPLTVSTLELGGEARAAWLTFTLIDGRGRVRSVGALLLKKTKAAPWLLEKEWSAECGPLGELGFIRQKQTFASPKPGVLARQFHDTTVEGIAYTLDCGCPACASRTTEFKSDESFTWNAQSGTFERTHHEKRYVVQPGEGLMAVARKALGDARMLQKLYKMNPAIKPESMLKEKQEVIVEE
jgi:hypothetical protein